jgi:hypothetical protein
LRGAPAHARGWSNPRYVNASAVRGLAARRGVRQGVGMLLPPRSDGTKGRSVMLSCPGWAATATRNEASKSRKNRVRSDL